MTALNCEYLIHRINKSPIKTKGRRLQTLSFFYRLQRDYKEQGHADGKDIGFSDDYFRLLHCPLREKEAAARSLIFPFLAQRYKELFILPNYSEKKD